MEIPDHLAETVAWMSMSPQRIVSHLEQRGFHHLYIDGGKTIQSFLQAGLINDLIITRVPILIGSGIPLFGFLSQDVKLHHLQTRSFPSGLVQTHYQVISN